MNWIKASELLPDDGVNVLVSLPAAKQPVWIAHRHEGRWYFERGVPVTFAINAWMPLPEPFQGE